jgi:hypothetical protein
MNFRCRAALILSALVLLTPGASAQLLMHVDTTEKTIWFTGSSAVSFTLGNVTWSVGNSSVNPYYLGVPNLITSTQAYGSAPFDAYLDMTGSGGNAYGLNFNFSATSGATTLTGQGPASYVNYAGPDMNSSSLDATALGFIEGTSSLPLVAGTGVGPLSIVFDSRVSAIPEPSTYAALLAACALGLAAYRRRQLASGA